MLYFDDDSNDRITVISFIVREATVAFHFDATWNGMTTHIKIDGIATQQAGRYIINDLVPQPVAAGFYPVTVDFSVEPFNGGIEVKGRWKTQVTEIDFSGELY